MSFELPNFAELLRFDAHYHSQYLLELLHRIDNNICKHGLDELGTSDLCIDTASNYCSRVVSSPTPPFFVEACYEQHHLASLRYLRYGDTNRIDITYVHVDEWDPEP